MIARIDKTPFSIFLFALALRVFFGAAVRTPPDRSDVLRYESLATEGRFTVHQAPVYPVAVRLIYRVFGVHNYSAVFVIQGIASSLIVLLMYALVVNTFDRKAALMAALISALYPNFILYNLTVLPESLIVLLIASIAAVAAAGIERTREACVEGALAGFGILVKPSLVFLVPGLLVFSRRRLVFLLLLAATVAPWIIRNAVVYDRLVPVYGAGAFNVSLDQYSGDWESIIDAIYSRAESLYGAHLGVPASKPGARAAPLAVFTIRKFSYLALLLLGCIAMARYFKREHLKTMMPILGAVLIEIFTAEELDVRFRALLEIPLIAYAGALLSRIRGPAGAD